MADNIIINNSTPSTGSISHVVVGNLSPMATKPTIIYEISVVRLGSSSLIVLVAVA